MADIKQRLLSAVIYAILVKIKMWCSITTDAGHLLREYGGPFHQAGFRGYDPYRLHISNLM